MFKIIQHKIFLDPVQNAIHKSFLCFCLLLLVTINAQPQLPLQRRFDRNPGLCDIESVISKDTVKVVPEYATALEIESIAICRYPYEDCAKLTGPAKDECCQSAKYFCMARTASSAACRLYCSCWSKSCENSS